MKEFANYDLIEQLNESQRSFIYKALNRNTGETSVLKILKTRHPTLSDTARFRHEYEIIKNSNIPGIVKTRNITAEHNTVAIELEYFKGKRLKDLIGTPWMSLNNYLKTAISLAETVGALHKEGISHRDIKPQNILINPKTGDVKITDFGISSIITHENEKLYNPEVIEGTIFYMSPEQTGRMNRTVDYRTDIYSLGITFYEMATGNPPFMSDDPMEIIFSHMAKTPQSASRINPEIPEILSAIINKCLAKTAEERYQNSYGLAADLKTCLAHYEGKGSIPEFPIAQKDFSDRLNIPQKLYGREEETELLLSAFQRIATGAKELCLVSGSSGIGKSVFVQELQKPIVEKRGYYIFGKYDQFKRDVPYSGFIQALQILVQHILTESEEKINIWKTKLLSALGSNGKIVTDAIPALELIIGEQPLLPELGAEGSQNRFLSAFKNFISVFTRREHPLVIFLDDLQWADTASLNMLERLMLDKDMRYFLIIGAYKENELNTNPRFTRLVEFLKESRIIINTIKLGAISLEDFLNLLLDTFKCSAEKALPLAELIHDKTGGNPFFFIQFIKTLYDEQMINCTQETGWEWDMDKIKSMEVTENVVELMAEKISTLSPAGIEILKVCACIGNRFDLETLSIVYEKSMDEIIADLSEVIKEGMIFYSEYFYRFLHDRIHEAAYSLIPDKEKPALHYRIGKWVMKNRDEKSLKEMVFYIVNHLNLAIDLITLPDEKRKLIELNRIAGDKAKLSTAYESASKFYETALSLLEENQWTSNYETAFDIRMHLAECEHLNRNFKRAEELFSEMIDNSKNDLDKARVYNLRVMMIASTGRHDKAVTVGLEGLAILGIKINPNSGNFAIGLAALKIKFLMRGKSVESIGNQKLVDDEKNLLLMQYLMNLVTTAYYYKIELSLFLAIKMFELTLKHGLSKYSSYACLVYGTVLASGLGDYKTGFRISELALKLNERFDNIELRSRLALVFGATISVWKDHPDKTIDYIKQAFTHSIDNGDLNYAIFTVQSILINMLPAGIHLDQIYKECTSHMDFIIELRDSGAINYLISVRQFVQALKGETALPGSMDDSNFSETDHIAAMEKDAIPIIIQRHHLLKAQIQYLFNNYNEALISSNISDKLIKYSLGQIVVPEHYFYRGMILASICDSAGTLKKILYRKKIKSILKYFIKWVNLNPVAFTDKMLMLKAELARLKGDNLAALSFYSRASDAAIKAGFRHIA
ncbi:MAG: serine/threonine-protein kinase PknK, partial [Spirochaetota bacterium]